MATIKITFRKLAELCEQSSGITFRMTNGREITWVGHDTFKDGRKRRTHLTVRMKDGWGFVVEKENFDSQIEICD